SLVSSCAGLTRASRLGEHSALMMGMAGTSPAMTEGLFGWKRDTHLAGDAAIVLDTAVALEVEDSVLVESRGVEIAIGDDQFIVFGPGLRDDFAIRIDDQAAAEQRVPVLHAALRGRDHEGRILIGAGLH